MNMMTIPDVELVENNSQRTPCVLVLDGSGSMQDQPIRELNEGLRVLEQELKADTTTSVRVQLLIIRAGDNDEVEILSDWTDAIDFETPAIEANGRTPLGAAMAVALDKIEAQKANYDANGIPSTRSWIMLLSDGAPTDYSFAAPSSGPPLELLSRPMRNGSPAPSGQGSQGPYQGQPDPRPDRADLIGSAINAILSRVGASGNPGTVQPVSCAV